MNDKKSIHRQQYRKRQQGLSLVELMIAMTLGLFLIWGVLQSFLTSRQVYDMQQALSRIQENTRMAQEFIAFDIRSAGDYGCASGDNFLLGAADVRNAGTCTAGPPYLGTTGINMITATTSVDDDFKYAVYGFDNVVNGALAIGAATGTLNPVPKAGTDVLMVHVAEEIGTLKDPIPNVIGPPAILPPTLAGSIASLTLLVKQPTKALLATDRIAVSDCATTKIFGINAAAIDSEAIALNGNYCSAAAFQAGASVRKLSTVYYYVSGSSLYRAVGNATVTGAAVELLTGVDDMQLEFGIDNAGNADGVIDIYKPANDLTGAAPATAAAWENAWNGWDWVDEVAPTADHIDYSLVRAVRYSLLMNANTPNLLADPQQLLFNNQVLVGGVVGPGGDKSLRQVVTSTVGIRSKMK
jgi:type IV pilus assembly protein PilW